MISRFRLFVACLVTMLAALAAQAQAPGDAIVSFDVISGGADREGRLRGALHVTLSDGWHTYWRAPGDAGIPPEIVLQGSENVAAYSIIWPTPKVYRQNGMRSIVYNGQLVLPLQISPRKAGQPVRLKGQLHIGICADMCLPIALDFDQWLDASAGPHSTIAAAIAARPYSAREAGVQSARCSMSQIEGGLRLTAQIAMPSAGGQEEVVIEPGSIGLWASTPKTRREGGVLVAVSDIVSVREGAMVLDRSRVRITVLGASHAVDILGCKGA